MKRVDHRRWIIVSAIAVAMSASAASTTPPRRGPAETTSVKVTAKVFVTESGTPKSVEVLSVEPSLDASTEADFKKEATRALLTWTFEPGEENGEPVAAYVVVPVIIDIAEPIPVRGP